MRPCQKPAKRAAIALAVKVGSVLETDQERGVAHILEHLVSSNLSFLSRHMLLISKALIKMHGYIYGRPESRYGSA